MRAGTEENELGGPMSLDFKEETSGPNCTRCGTDLNLAPSLCRSVKVNAGGFNSGRFVRDFETEAAADKPELKRCEEGP